MVTTWTKNLDLAIGAQLKKYFETHKRPSHPFVTLSRQFGCDGVKLAHRIVAHMNSGETDQEWFVIDRDQLLAQSKVTGLTEDTLRMLEEFGHSDMQSYIREAVFGMGNQVETVRQIAKVQRLFADRGNVVFLGGGASIITKDLAHGLHVLLYAPLEWRIQNHASRHNLELTEARANVMHQHGEREAFVKTYLGTDINDPEHYHLTLNNARLSVDAAAELVVHMLKTTHRV